jgi:hypothetical protein
MFYVVLFVVWAVFCAGVVLEYLRPWRRKP